MTDSPDSYAHARLLRMQQMLEDMAAADASPAAVRVYPWVPKACALNAHVRRLASWTR